MTIRAPVFTIHPVWPRPQDFAWPNVALTASAQTKVKPVVVGVIDETRPAVLYRSLDFQFPNVVLQAAAQQRVRPIGAAIDETVPAALARQLDFQFPNLALTQTIAAPFTRWLFNQREAPPPAPLPSQYVFPNLALLNFEQQQVRPVGAAIDEIVPAALARQPDFLFPNLLISSSPAFSSVVAI
jgi:hypothetical protein